MGQTQKHPGRCWPRRDELSLNGTNGAPWRQTWVLPLPVSRFALLQVNVKRPMKDETHFEVVESGRYIILLLGKALSVVWDHHLSISVVLKQTYQVSGLPPLPHLVCDLLLGPSSVS